LRNNKLRGKIGIQKTPVYAAVHFAQARCPSQMPKETKDRVVLISRQQVQPGRERDWVGCNEKECASPSPASREKTPQEIFNQTI